MSNNPEINAALLKFCASVDDGPRGPPSEPAAPRDPVDLQWLSKAIESVETPERQIRRLLDTVDEAGASRDREDECVDALTELADLVEDINWATEYALMDGPARAIRLLRDAPLAACSPAVRAAAAMAIAHSAQLHPRVQADYAAARWADALLPLLQREVDEEARAAMLHACSCICRDDAANPAQFVAAGGAAVLLELLGDACAKIVRRALFFAAYLVESNEICAAGDQAALAERAGAFAVGEVEELQTAAARILAALALKNAAGVQVEMGRPQLVARLAEWRGAELDEDDSRRRLAQLFDNNKRSG